MKLKEFMKANLNLENGDWIGGIFSVFGGKVHVLLNESLEVDFDHLDPRLKEICLNSEVTQYFRKGPYNSSYMYEVKLDLRVESCKTYAVTEVVLEDGSKFISKGGEW